MKLNKLRTMSLGEVHYRLRMAGEKRMRRLLREKYRAQSSPGGYLPKWRLPAETSASFVEAVARKNWPQAEAALLHYMRGRFSGGAQDTSTPHFFIEYHQKNEIVAQARSLPGMPEAMAYADRLLERRFSYLNIAADFSSGIDWQMDPISRLRWPQKFYTEMKFYGQHDGERELPGDVKYVWELNRHHHFAILGKAYWLTGEERYAGELLAQCESWIEQNPYLWGINWTSALEAGMRALSWLWAYFFCLQSNSLTAHTHARLLRTLQLHARYINRHLSFYTSPYNHLVGESVALFIIALLFPEFPESQHWRERAWEILTEEVTKQFHADGMSVEQAISYHHFTLGLYLQAMTLAQRNGILVPALLRERLERALEFSMYSQQPNGRHPMLGDNDDAVAFYFKEKPAWDFREYLALGAVLFQRGDFKLLAGNADETCLWLLGPQSFRQFDELAAHPPANKCLLLRESGYAVLRAGWQREAQYLMLDCGPQSHGLFADDNVSTAHGHPDALSINLSAHGRPFLIDAGMLTYNGDLRWQNYFRSGAAHNTITVDGESACKVVGRLGYAHVPAVEQSAFINTNEFVFVEAHLTGFGCRIRHRRSIFYRRGDYWLVLDNLSGEGEHQLERWYHFAPELAVQNSNAQIIAAYSETQKLLLRDLSGPASSSEIFCGGEAPEQGWIAPAYGCKIAAPVLCLRAFSALPAQFITLLLPFSGRTPALRYVCSSHDGTSQHEQLAIRLITAEWEDRIVLEGKEIDRKISASRKMLD